MASFWKHFRSASVPLRIRGVLPYIIILAAGLWMPALGAFAWAQSAPDRVSDEILVAYAAVVDPAVLGAEAGRLGAVRHDLLSVRQALLAVQALRPQAQIERLQVERLRLAPGADRDRVLENLRASPLIRYAEPNYLRYALAPLPAGPNDTLYQPKLPEYPDGAQWWLEAVTADRVVAENLLTQPQAVTIAIIDSGIMLAHEDLAAKLVAGVTLISAAVLRPGYFPPALGEDDNGHGTHVAGIAAAMTNNHLGVAGTASADAVRLMPVKVLNDQGAGTDFDIARGVLWAAAAGARVLNLSLGAPSVGMVIQEAINEARRQGCVIVAAAGNNALDDLDQPYNPVIYPAAFPGVIAVAACDRTGTRAFYSEFGSFVDLAAPGGLPTGGTDAQVGILSTALYTALTPPEGRYDTKAGTSMAAPVVAGAAAMLLAQDPSRGPDAVENLLTATADKTGVNSYTSGWNPYLGWGRVNLSRALLQQTTFVPSAGSRPSYNFPNPFRPGRAEQTSIVVPLSAGQSVAFARLRIFDAVGRLVRTVNIPPAGLFPGALVPWDGRNDLGHPVGNGVYPYRLELDGAVHMNKIVVKD